MTKVRFGFVTNSSSSSFIIEVRNGKLTEEVVRKALGVDETSMLRSMADAVAQFLIGAVEEVNNEECEEWEDYNEKELLKKGWKVFRGRASSDGEGIEPVICEMTIDYKSKDLIIRKDGGY